MLLHLRGDVAGGEVRPRPAARDGADLGVCVGRELRLRHGQQLRLLHVVARVLQLQLRRHRGELHRTGAARLGVSLHRLGLEAQGLDPQGRDPQTQGVPLVDGGVGRVNVSEQGISPLALLREFERRGLLGGRSDRLGGGRGARPRGPEAQVPHVKGAWGGDQRRRPGRVLTLS